MATQLDSVGPSHGFSSADSGLDQSESSLIPQNIEYLLISSLKTSGKLPVLASFVVQVTSKVVRREFSNLLPSSSVCGMVYGACMQSQAWEPHLSLTLQQDCSMWPLCPLDPEPHGRPRPLREAGVASCGSGLGLNPEQPPRGEPLGL